MSKHDIVKRLRARDRACSQKDMEEAVMIIKHKKRNISTAIQLITKYGVVAALAQAQWYLSQSVGPGTFQEEWEEVVAILQEKKDKVDEFKSEKGGE